MTNEEGSRVAAFCMCRCMAGPSEQVYQSSFQMSVESNFVIALVLQRYAF